jgi:hypothetical protein
VCVCVCVCVCVYVCVCVCVFVCVCTYLQEARELRLAVRHVGLVLDQRRNHAPQRQQRLVDLPRLLFPDVYIVREHIL